MEQTGEYLSPSGLDFNQIIPMMMPLMVVMMMMGMMMKAAGGNGGNSGNSKSIEGAYSRALSKYQKPKSVNDGLKQSVNEEIIASTWYHMRAENARAKDDLKTAELYEHIAAEEDAHRDEFSKMLREIIEL